MIYRTVDRLRSQYPVFETCRVLGVFAQRLLRLALASRERSSSRRWPSQGLDSRRLSLPIRGAGFGFATSGRVVAESIVPDRGGDACSSSSVAASETGSGTRASLGHQPSCTMILAVVAVADRRLQSVLRSLVAMKDHILAIPPQRRHVECGDDQLGSKVVLHRPAHHSSTEHVENHRKVGT